MEILQGTKVSAGIAIGYVERLDGGSLGLHRIVRDPSRERALYEAAIVLAKDELRRLQQRAKDDEADMLMFQIALLEDNSFTNEIGDYIAAGAGSAAAVERAEQIFAARLLNVDDDYIRQRSIDVRDVCRRVVDILDGRPRRRLFLTRPTILAADQFLPSDLLDVDRRMILGLVSDGDNMSSHAAIIARTMGLPAVFRLGQGASMKADGQYVVLDGNTGTLILDPTPQVVAQAEENARNYRTVWMRDMLLDVPSRTVDGTSFVVLAGASQPTDVEKAIRLGADGIGLVRTERMVLENVTEERQYFRYLNCLAAARNKPVTVRTFDVGADDGAPWVKNVPSSINDRQAFATQIRALLRAGVHGDVGIALPMITSQEDWEQRMQQIETCRLELQQSGVEYAGEVPIGCMIDMPAAALVAEELISHGAQFLVVDIDDLTRHTTGVSRQEDPDHYRVDTPAVQRLVKHVMDTAAKYNIPAGLCSITELELAAIPAYLRAGVRYFCTENACLKPLKALLARQDLSAQP